MSQIVVEVPATLSNLGPGFDVLGMAVDISNRFEFRVLDEPRRFEAYQRQIEPRKHLALKTIIDACAEFGGELPGGLAVEQVEDVPRSRGLGSSATARVAGLVAWSAITGVRPDLASALAFLAKGEGHPDNAVPAMVGGLTLCAETDGGLVHRRFDPPDLQVALCIPDRTVETAAARKVMPLQYSRDDVVFSTSRIALLLTGLLTGDDDALRVGCEDRIHQPYRKPLIGPVDDALDAARQAGAVAAFISGSGSTLAAFVRGDARAVSRAMAVPFETANVRCQTRTARPSARGAWPSG